MNTLAVKSKIDVKLGSTFFVGSQKDVDMDHLNSTGKKVIECCSYKDARGQAKEYADKINSQQKTPKAKRIVRVPGVRQVFAVAETSSQLRLVGKIRRQKKE